ncbi:site-specific integrase [Leisingera sp. S132]|uniref:site-specific integrase n=1 Tax=Leisingera sp. S132 TaxID=2867016 RepID=UPI0021A60901|nr:site-specific integrase [Leisingera sp. S132]UWQ77943.1 site-specific integrase [Leisingera sp. S132]
MARYLACCGKSISKDPSLAHLRHEHLRAHVKDYFRRSLEKYDDWLARTGGSPKAKQILELEHESHCYALGGLDDLASDTYLENHKTKFINFCTLPGAAAPENVDQILQELRKARRDQIEALLERISNLERYSFQNMHEAPEQPATQPVEASSPLGTAVEDFITEHSRQWAKKTIGQNKAYLNILVEYFGPDRPLGTITKQDANEVKKVLQALPASRNTKPKLKAMPLRQVIKEPGHNKIAPKTINSHIQMFKGFFDWAERHGYAPHTLFDGMKVAKAKNSDTERKPFSHEQARQLYNELTENTSGLVRKDSHKWAMLLGMFTGARLNEICQLDVADVQVSDGIWFLNITDEGDNNKRLKTTAGKRKVPLHSELISIGFLDFVKSRNSATRLFPDYSFSANGGYGRNLGRWCNESFLPKLAMKEPGLVFHSLRHTVVTRLSQASVPEPIIQCLVGHARSGVTQEVYNREGYTLLQLQEAVNCLAPPAKS